MQAHAAAEQRATLWGRRATRRASALAASTAPQLCRATRRAHSTCESYEWLLPRVPLVVVPCQSSAPSRARSCRALRKCGESEHQSTGTATPPEPPRQRTLPGTRLHSGARTCSPPLAAASRTELPDAPERRRARAPPRVLAAWPAVRLVAGRAALACDSSSGTPCPGLLAGTSPLAATHPKPSRSGPARRRGPLQAAEPGVMIIDLNTRKR
jgi:hypothetical protein